MKSSLEISFDGQKHKTSYASAIPLIKRIPNPYVGNKKKLLPFILKTLDKHNLDFNSFFDAFSGSGVVGLMMKCVGKKVLSNDILTSCFMNSVALVENNGIKLTSDEIDKVLKQNNPNATDFVRTHWAQASGLHNRFTQEEALRLDNIRANIKDLTNEYAQSLSLCASSLVCMKLPFGFIDKSVDIYNHRKKQILKYGKDSDNHDRRIGIYLDEDMNLNFKEWFPKYVKTLQSGIPVDDETKVKIKSSIMWHSIENYLFRKCFKFGRFNHAQVLADPVERIKKDGELRFLSKDINKASFSGFINREDVRCIATNCDAIELLKSGFVDVDCAYFDPPYGGSSSNYGYLYQFFEEYIYEKSIEELPHYMNNCVNKFANAKDYEENFVELLSSAISIPIWIISYNDSSWKDLNYIVELIKTFRKNVIVESVPYDYHYRGKRGNKVKLSEQEHLIIARD